MNTEIKPLIDAIKGKQFEQAKKITEALLMGKVKSEISTIKNDLSKTLFNKVTPK